MFFSRGVVCRVGFVSSDVMDSGVVVSHTVPISSRESTTTPPQQKGRLFAEPGCWWRRRTGIVMDSGDVAR